jgi:hypothetical protein
MAVKPLNTTPIFASASVYTVGPKVNRPTKSMDLGAGLAAQGHVPGKDFPTASNEFNAWLNVSSLLTDWLHQGSNEKVFDARVVETDAFGRLSASRLDVGGTTATGPSAIFSENTTGAVVQIRNNNGVGEALEIRSESTTAGSPQCITMTNDRTGFASHMVTATITGGSDSLGGASYIVASDRDLANNGIQSRDLSALNTVNSEGTAVEAISRSLPLPAIRALNVEDGGASIKAGYGNEDTTPSNLSGTAIDARGGDGDASFGTIGGHGIYARGGDAADGAFDTAGGHGIFAKGGRNALEPGGYGMFCQSTGENSSALFVEHESTLNNAALAIFRTRDNGADGIFVDCEGTGNALRAYAQGGYGLYLEQSPNTGGRIKPHIGMEPQSEPSFGPDITSAGDLWVQESPSGPHQLRYNPDNTRQFLARYNQPWCSASNFVVGAITPTATTTNLTPLMTLAFTADQVPTENTDVLIEAYGEILPDNPQGGEQLVALEIYDDTAASSVASTTINFGPRSGGNAMLARISRRITIPAGMRSYTLNYNLPATSDSSGNQALNWVFKISPALS